MDIMSLYRQVTVVSDIMFVNIISFIISFILHMKFGTVEYLENCHIPTLVKAVLKTKNTYVMRRFNLAVINMDPEFEPLCANLADFNTLLNVYANNDHSP